MNTLVHRYATSFSLAGSLDTHIVKSIPMLVPGEIGNWIGDARHAQSACVSCAYRFWNIQRHKQGALAGCGVMVARCSSTAPGGVKKSRDGIGGTHDVRQES